MSELQQSSAHTLGPTKTLGAASPSKDGAVEAYRRALESKPTAFSENPIGAMAQAVDKIGKAAGTVFSGKSEGKGLDLTAAETRLKTAVAQMRANPSSQKAKQGALLAGLELLKKMGGLAPNDPRRLSVAKFVVGLANQLGASGLSLQGSGLDVRGMLRIAAQILSRFGSPADMQAAFNLESLLKASLPQSSATALAVRDELMQRFGLSQQARGLLSNNWAVRVANAGEVPKLDLSARTIVLDAAQSNPSLGVLARAFWHDQSMRSPQERDSFIEAFKKVASLSTMSLLTRKYREVRDHARRELQQGRISVLGKQTTDSLGNSSVTVDEGVDMFASLASFELGEANHELPIELRAALDRFYSPK